MTGTGVGDSGIRISAISCGYLEPAAEARMADSRKAEALVAVTGHPICASHVCTFALRRRLQRPLHHPGDLRGGGAVAVRITKLGATGVFDGIGEQTARGGDDAIGVGADELAGTGVDPFGTLGVLAHDQHGLAQRRRFLLHAAGIGEHEERAVHQPDEILVGRRRGQRDARMAAEQATDRLLDLRIKMDGIKHAEVRMSVDQPADALTEILEAGAE